MTSVLVLCLSDFSKIFKIVCDASEIEIDRVFSQEGHPVAFFSEKPNDSKHRCSTYGKEFYTMVQILKFWRHYLLPQEFILYFDHEALRFLNS